MFRRIATAATFATTLALGVAAPAQARHHYRDYGYQDRYDGYRGGYYRGDYDGRRSGYYRSGYDGRRGYGRCYDKGNGGLAIGAIAGGLLGNTVAGHHDKLLGTVLGAAGGGLLGRSIDRSDGRPC